MCARVNVCTETYLYGQVSYLELTCNVVYVRCDAWYGRMLSVNNKYYKKHRTLKMRMCSFRCATMKN